MDTRISDMFTPLSGVFPWVYRTTVDLERPPNFDYSNPYEFQSDSESYVNSEIYETADQTKPSSRSRIDSRYANLPSVSRIQQPYANVNGESIYYVTF